MTDTWILYQTTNLTNSKIYVGVHKLADTSRSRRYLGSGDRLKAAIKKYGRKNFTRITLAEFSCSEDAYLAEAEMVTQEFINREDTYNISLGGREGRPLTPESKAKIGSAHKGKLVSEETRRKLSIANKGKKISEEHRAKIVAAHSKPETKAKIRAANSGANNSLYGKHHTEATKAKIAATNKGQKRSPETKAKLKIIAANRKGRVDTEQAKAKRSAKLMGAGTPSSLPVIINGVYYESIKRAANILKINDSTIQYRIKSNSLKWFEWRPATESEKLEYTSSKLQYSNTFI